MLLENRVSGGLPVQDGDNLAEAQVRTLPVKMFGLGQKVLSCLAGSKF